MRGGHKGHPKQTRGRPQDCSQRAPSAGDRRQASEPGICPAASPREGAAVPSHSLGSLLWTTLGDFLLTLHLPQSPLTFPLPSIPATFLWPSPSHYQPASLPGSLMPFLPPISLRPAAFLSILTACCRALLLQNTLLSQSHIYESSTCP